MELHNNAPVPHLSRRAFLRTGALGLTSLAFIGSAYAITEKDEYDLVERTIAIKHLPDSFRGFTIGLMSDIHSSVFMNRDDMKGYVAAMNALKTDIIFVTGDFVNSKTEEVYPFAEAFSQLNAPHGVYGVLGNHDYFADVETVAKEVDGCGVKLIRNDTVKITRGDAFINLVGVDDIGRGVKPAEYIGRALSGVSNDAPRILLCHKPYFMDEFSNNQFDLVFSGHTHGGQIVFAKINDTYITPASLFSKYVWGLYKQNGTQMYVNRGIGSVGLPFRVNCPPELTKVTLA
ncbi:MAG TPA: metallophosphoesterase [Bacteroidota bacterium]|nr:metallophosphoesterase [Bacteroidota bacterium]